MRPITELSDAELLSLGNKPKLKPITELSDDELLALDKPSTEPTGFGVGESGATSQHHPIRPSVPKTEERPEERGIIDTVVSGLKRGTYGVKGQMGEGLKWLGSSLPGALASGGGIIPVLPDKIDPIGINAKIKEAVKETGIPGAISGKGEEWVKDGSLVSDGNSFVN